MRLKNITISSLFKTAETEAEKLPKLVVRAEKAAASIYPGDNKQRKPSTGEDFWQFREYTSSDRPQDIDWRQTAKSDAVYIKQRELQTNQQFYIWCQSNPSMEYSSKRGLQSKLDSARILSMASHLILSKAGQKVRTSYSTTAQSFDIFSQDLLNAETETLPRPINPKTRKASLILIGDFLSSFTEMEKTFSSFKSSFSDVFILQTLDPAEINLPFSGRMIFDTLGYQGQSEKLDDIDGIRDEYKKRIDNHNRTLGEFCRNNQWHYILHQTDTSESQTLSALWQILHGDERHLDTRSAQSGRSQG
jgi:uncharacterized protein (DUF58 family)